MKNTADVQVDTVCTAERQLALRYQRLATILANRPLVVRELLLTAFSLHPNR